MSRPRYDVRLEMRRDVRCDVRCDVLIVGGSLGGVAAAIQAGEMGASVILIEESSWIGGQLTSQGVCTPDENHMGAPRGHSR